MLADELYRWVEREGERISKRFPGMEIRFQTEIQTDRSFAFLYKSQDEEIEAHLFIWEKGEVNAEIINYPEALKDESKIWSIADSFENIQGIQFFADNFFDRISLELKEHQSL